MAVRMTHDPEADAVYIVLRDVPVAHLDYWTSSASRCLPNAVNLGS